MSSRGVLFTAVLVTVVLSTGCALSKDYVDLNYEAQTGVAKVPGAESIQVEVELRDVRQKTDRVGSKTNAYGSEMAAIVSNQDVVKLVKSSIETELKGRGYPLSAGNVKIQCEIHTFYNKFEVGFWSGTAAATVQLNVKIKDRAGNYIFSEFVRGEGRKEHIQLASGKNAKPALDDALKSCLKSLFEMPDFFKAIERAGKPSP